MKKTVTVNLSGIVFHIDEDAYELLSNYLNLINARFSDENEAKEIMADIESRIAEIFSEKLQGRQVIEIQDIEEIMATIGKPEDFESSGYKEENEAFSEAQKGYKR
ncbi:MAG TPA: PspC family transcriptional regulator, partial [Bacteroidia bacterium]|nr:PspC family transcriptional regulator [Bacteroidia bacterium]